MRNLVVQIEPFSDNPELNSATERGFKAMKSPDVLAIFDNAGSDSVKHQVLDLLGGEKISQPHIDNSVEAHLIRSDKWTFPGLIELFQTKAIKGIPVKIDLSGDFRRVITDNVQIEMRHLVIVGHTQPVFP